MCRLMGYVAFDATTLEKMAGPKFSEFAALSAVHNDGWGIATVDANKSSSLVLEPTPAIDSPKFLDSAKNLESDGALLHFRWATAGLEVVEANTHPFHYEQYSFIHNGGIMPKESLDPLMDADLLSQRRGQTDSERYFFVLISHIRKRGLIDGALEGVREIRSQCDFSSLNSMLLTPKYYIVICEHNNQKIPGKFPPDYYELAYRQDENGILVASSGWDQSGWSALPNHRALVVNRENMEIDIFEI